MIDRGLLGQLLGDNPEIATEEAPLHDIRTFPGQYPAWGRMTDLAHLRFNLHTFSLAIDAGTPCPSCTSIIDSLDGAAQHLRRRLNLAL